MQGKAVFEEFYKANNWISDYFSKFEVDLKLISNTNKPIFTKCLEIIFSTSIGKIIDDFFKRITLQKWKSKFNFLTESDFDIALKSTRNISKHHPSNFQKKVLVALNTKIEEVATNFNIVLPKEHV